MMENVSVDVNLKDLDSNALEYIIDLIQADMNANSGNSIRGSSLFQNVMVIANLLKQEIYMAKNREYEKEHPRDKKADEMDMDWNKPSKHKGFFTKPKSVVDEYL